MSAGFAEKLPSVMMSLIAAVVVHTCAAGLCFTRVCEKHEFYQYNNILYDIEEWNNHLGGFFLWRGFNYICCKLWDSTIAMHGNIRYRRLWLEHMLYIYIYIEPLHYPDVHRSIIIIIFHATTEWRCIGLRIQWPTYHKSAARPTSILIISNYPCRRQLAIPLPLARQLSSPTSSVYTGCCCYYL